LARARRREGLADYIRLYLRRTMSAKRNSPDIARNPLKSPDSQEEMKGNANKFKPQIQE
jgi:hypothetical protein